MKAVIISDDFAFATNAAATLARVGRQSSINVHWTTRCWSTSTFTKPALAESILVEAKNAHLIAFPSRIAQCPPACVFAWLGRWAALRSVRYAALGVIKFGNGADLTNTKFPELSGFARQHGLNLIVDESPPVRSLARLSIHFPAGQVLPIAQKYSAVLASPGSFREFGINE